MKKFLFAIVVSCAAFACGDAFDGQVASIVLLQDKAIQTELKITEAQRAKLNTYGGKFNSDQKAYYAEMEKKLKANKNTKPDQAREMKMLMDLKTKVLATLNASQLKRLREISLQAIGVTALADETVASRVGLNASQKTKIQGLLQSGLQAVEKIQRDTSAQAGKGIAQPKTKAEQEAAQKKFSDRMRTLGPPAEAKIESVRRKTITDVLAILTPGQNTIWRALLGPMFKPKG
ncbi:MAG: hypothetical protein ABL949_11335 [Fimbriimonadaceae bacterium]